MKIKKHLKENSYIYLVYCYLRMLYLKIFVGKVQQRQEYIKKRFKKRLGYDIDFSILPKTFNQKIQFRKLYDKNPLYCICADKYRVREYIKEKIGEQYLIPLYLVTDRLTMEQWQQLPNSFVAKANHNSGPVQIVKDKSKVKPLKIITELNYQLKTDFGVLSMEQYYGDIPRKIIVEKYLDHSGDTLEDFKFHVFGRSNKIFIEHIVNRTHDGEIYENLYTKNWEKLNFAIGAKVYAEKRDMPQNLNKMVEIAEILGKDFDYVRVDLYNIKGKIYFGELTFCGDSGFGKFTDEKWDYKFGEFWNQNKLK